jgi:KipI family sensor histidine kinase inhibitor
VVGWRPSGLVPTTGSVVGWCAGAVNLRVLPCGPGAVLAEVDDAAAVAALQAWLAVHPVDGVLALVPAARTVLIEAAPERLASVRAHLSAFRPDAAEPPPVAIAEPVEIPVVYDGDDLDAVAAACDMTVDEVARRHSAPVYTAAFCGFAPGFAYLIGGDPALRLPRRADPRTRVPAGSVAIAGEFSAVYPTASPGGWHLLGRATVEVWDLGREPPALIAPGTRVRFRPVGTRRWP